MFVVFYTLNLYVCVYISLVANPTVFMTHLRIHGVYVCMYVRHSHCVTSSVYQEFEALFKGARGVEGGRGYNMM
jgi:hypothetical protein